MKTLKILPISFFRLSSERLINLQRDKKYDEAVNLYFEILDQFLSQDVKSDEGVEWLNSILEPDTLEKIAKQNDTRTNN